jgi:hypothetical protein
LFPSTAYRNEAYLLVVMTAFAGSVVLTAVLGAMVSGRLQKSPAHSTEFEKRLEKNFMEQEPS